jgi:transketolase C-terminal domain/subunit
MTITLDPTLTHDERRAALLDAATAAIEAARDSGDAALAERLHGLYSRASEFLELHARRQEAEAALQAAHAAWRAAGDPPGHHHAGDVAEARMLAEQTVSTFPLDTFDVYRDPTTLREGSKLYERLAKMARR